MELSESIKQYGVLHPLLVSDKKDYYEIIAGERRWRAAKLAGLTEIPVIVKEFSEQELVEISLIENIQREDLNPVEEAMAYKRLIDEFHLKQDEIAERVGAAALLMEWGIVKGNDPYLYGEKVKAYLRRGARQLPGEEFWPNERMGYGALCVRDSLPF